MNTKETDFLVVGGGIAGVSCAELLATLAPNASITLVTSGPTVKAVTDFSHLTKLLATFEVVEQSVDEWGKQHSRVRVVRGSLSALDPDSRTAEVDGVGTLRYGRVCLCTGSRPKLAIQHPLVLGVRDVQSVVELQTRLATASRVLVLGNGGIATELVHELEDVEVVWAIKDNSINATFVDPGAGEFLKSKLGGYSRESESASRRMRYSVRGEEAEGGSALGPDWHQGMDARGIGGTKKVLVEHGVTLERLLEPSDLVVEELVPYTPPGWDDGRDKWPVYALLSSGRIFGCDFVVSATGVIPGGEVFKPVLKVDSEGGIVVDEVMRTSRERVYAAGDLASPGWTLAAHWLPMRLWTQARQTGMQAAVAMVADAKGEDVTQDFCFEMFAHVTKFFGFKVVLLGLFNGQKLDRQYDILLRTTPGLEYVKVILKEGRMQGALLIGETDLEETFENLILNQLDLTSYGEDLLDPGIDIEDYFD